jgi:hypothetical protein
MAGLGCNLGSFRDGFADSTPHPPGLLLLLVAGQLRYVLGTLVFTLGG